MLCAISVSVVESVHAHGTTSTCLSQSPPASAGACRYTGCDTAGSADTVRDTGGCRCYHATAVAAVPMYHAVVVPDGELMSVGETTALDTQNYY